MPTNRSIDQINAVLDALIVQVNQINGNGLTPPMVGLIGQLQNRMNGLQETLNQVVLTLDAQLNTLQSQLTTLTTLVNTQLGLPPSS